MKCYVSLVCFLSVIVFVNSAPYNNNPGTQLQLGSNDNGGGLTNILSQIDLPGLLQGINSFVKLIGTFCTPCGQVLDNVIQNVTSTAFRIFGRAILQGGALGGRSGGGGGGNTVNVVLPTFPPDEDDYDEDETSSEVSEETNKNSATAATNLQSDLITSSPLDENNLISKRHIRAVVDDQALAESAPEPADLADIEDDQDRNKRFLPFGGGAGSGGSGNFLFDIVRLVAGSGATEESDEKANAPDGAESEAQHKSVDAHYSEGIPGPVTRLLVIANRGLANLIQDLILRLAQTSEKLVNFKARLITSLI
ncbi:uncharacterized protein LOC130897179 isoform X2 [Diorhabda carinulata]|uniref:uncharacterized protein LOC130897179 isoform X2 n=1 Tax=Diorhabda carinulata TaxID=1163345 RepID=UPI0025A27091|nr:uncharacterized protein LOC130897179 isoform X2 [Diorhabda carinulata]